MKPRSGFFSNLVCVTAALGLALTCASATWAAPTGTSAIESAVGRFLLAKTPEGIELMSRILGRSASASDIDELVSRLRLSENESVRSGLEARIDRIRRELGHPDRLTDEHYSELRTLALRELKVDDGWATSDPHPGEIDFVANSSHLPASSEIPGKPSIPVEPNSPASRMAREIPVMDQKYTLECYVITAKARAETQVSLNLGEPTELSARYALRAKTKAELVRLIITKQFKPYSGQLAEGGPMRRIYYEQGGIFADMRQTFRVYGMMPESAYPGFPARDVKVFEKFNKLIRSYAKRASSIDFSDPAVQAEIEKEVDGILNQAWGKVPETFVFKGKSYDSQSFFDEFLPEWKKPDAVELTYSPHSHNAKGTVKAFDGTPYTAYKTGNHSKLMYAIEEQLRAGKTPVLQYKVIDEEHTQKKGAIGFAVHGLTPPSSVNWRSPTVLDHYVMGLDPVWGPDGHLEAIWIKNTWDTSKSANLGFHRIEKDYFFLLEGTTIEPDMVARFRSEGVLE